MNLSYLFRLFSANEISEMRNFLPRVGEDSYTITFPQHPCVILNALEILGFSVVSSTSKLPSNDSSDIRNISENKCHSKHSIIWTLRKEFDLSL